ncbi:tetratricopeptide (TPR) repeat protein [Salinibacter ruber]|uniref:hypothetical protein n=1 Tax=Salinibacter ruber TaxID=146919 RepID=UPI002168C110|nr:hypothetical protein [Salinibacter ruber]MCS3939107.1 tetratricopeptide (TPR) repeat protein [Salinibacter ruber]
MIAYHRLFGAFLICMTGIIGGAGPLHAQTVELLYEEGGVFGDARRVTIGHADEKGTVPPETSVVRASDRVYFAVRPAGDWTFDPDDKQTLQNITPVQDTSVLVPETLTLVGGEEGARAAVMSMPKSRIDWFAPVTFRHTIDTTSGLSLSEQYAPAYPFLRRAYQEGQRHLNVGRPLRAIRTLRPFHGPVTPSFSFVDEAKALLDTASTQVLDEARSRFRTLRRDLVSEPDAAGLARLDSFRVRLDSIRPALVSYAEARAETDLPVQNRIETLVHSADQLYSDVRSTYRRETLRIFLRGTYDNSRLRLYLAALTQLLVTPDSAFAVSTPQVDPLQPAALDSPRHAELQRRLRSEGWAAGFREVVRLVNENIRERNEVFGAEIMKSLRLRRPAAPQPYFEVIAAMNARLAEDQTRFADAWGRALEKVTDVSLLNDLQRWRLASRVAPGTVPERALRLAEEARSHRWAGRLGAANARLQLAARLAEPYAPLYYELGELKQAQGDTLRAREDFRRARALAGAYAPPEVKMLRQLLAQQKYERALTRADSLLQEQSYWLLYLPKARALLGMNRHAEARRVLRGRCEPLNDESHALYALLAEAYAGMDVWEGVRWAVQQAEALRPRRSAFVERVSAVRATATERGLSLTKAAGDSISAEELRRRADTTRGIRTRDRNRPQDD